MRQPNGRERVQKQGKESETDLFPTGGSPARTSNYTAITWYAEDLDPYRTCDCWFSLREPLWSLVSWFCGLSSHGVLEPSGSYNASSPSSVGFHKLCLMKYRIVTCWTTSCISYNFTARVISNPVVLFACLFVWVYLFVGTKSLLFSHLLVHVCNQEVHAIQSVTPYPKAHAFRFSFLSLIFVSGNYLFLRGYRMRESSLCEIDPCVTNPEPEENDWPNNSPACALQCVGSTAQVTPLTGLLLSRTGRSRLRWPEKDQSWEHWISVMVTLVVCEFLNESVHLSEDYRFWYRVWNSRVQWVKISSLDLKFCSHRYIFRSLDWLMIIWPW